MGIGLTSRSFHYLTDKKSKHCLLARTILLKLLRARGNHFIDDLLQRRGVAGLMWPALFVINLGKIFVALEGKIVKILEHFAGDGAAFDQIGGCGYALHRDWGLLDL